MSSMKMIARCLFLFLLLELLFLPDLQQAEVSDHRRRQISVEVKGAVENPGIYTVEAFSTVDELLQQLQVSEKADLSALNRTLTLKDHDVIVIPEVSESGRLVSINSASAEELMRLPGVGPVTAASIISYRQQQGFFQSIDDLIKVKGIGPKTLEKIRPYVSL